MTRGGRWLVILVTGSMLLTVATLGFAVVRVRQAGSIALDLNERDGSRLALHLPAAAAQIAIPLIPRFVLRDVAGEIEPWVPVAVAMSDDLADAPDFVLVEIESPTEHVRIAKRGKDLTIQVEDGSGSFSLAVPLATVRSLLNRLAAA